MHETKRRKTGHHGPKDAEIDTSKPSAKYFPTEGRQYTLSVAIPGSIIANAQTHELKTLLAGQIARALAVFCVDEVIVFDDGQSYTESQNNRRLSDSYGKNQSSEYTGFIDPGQFLARLLTYLETPPHLRKLLFPIHPDLRMAGTLNSLDMPHHLRAHEWCQYREGVSLGHSNTAYLASNGFRRNTNNKRFSDASSKLLQPVSYVEVGFESPVRVQSEIPEHARVTLKFPDMEASPGFQSGGQSASAVSPLAPKEEQGFYWGYQVRTAKSLSGIVTECPFDGGYDLTWGTSERGHDLDRLASSSQKPIPQFSHFLIVFGGVAGLEAAARADPDLASMGIVSPEDLFDYWVNICPGQGSRTIRTEEALWIGLMGIKNIVSNNGTP